MTAPVQSRRARQTGRVVEVWRAAELGVEDPAGEWVTICVQHASSCHHATRALAVSWAAEPLTWCEDCQVDTRQCGRCGGRCHWVDDAWVCRACGDEWYPDHGPEYAAPA